jgi:hypothetical protein
MNNFICVLCNNYGKYWCFMQQKSIVVVVCKIRPNKWCGSAIFSLVNDPYNIIFDSLLNISENIIFILVLSDPMTIGSPRSRMCSSLSQI